MVFTRPNEKLMAISRPYFCYSVKSVSLYCSQTVRPRAKDTIDSLLEVVYEESIGIKMNDLDLCLEVV